MIRHIDREQLKRVWQPILLADVNENLEKTEGRMVREIYDAPA
jgi:hypothetical protein